MSDKTVRQLEDEILELLAQEMPKYVLNWPKEGRPAELIIAVQMVLKTLDYLKEDCKSLTSLVLDYQELVTSNLSELDEADRAKADTLIGRLERI